VSLFEKHLGADHPDLALALERRAQLIGQMGRVDEAAGLTARAAKARAKKRP